MSLWGFLSPFASLKDVIARLNEKLPLLEHIARTSAGAPGEPGEPGEPGGSDRLTQPDTTQLLMTDITDGYLLSRDGTDIAGVDPDTVGAVLNLFGSYEAKANGLVGDGSTDDRTALNTLANTTIAAGGGTIEFSKPGEYRISSDLTIPEHVTLKFARGAMLEIDAGKVVTIKGEIQAGYSQIFSGTGFVRLALATDLNGNSERGKTPVVRPQWWGAVGDGIADDFFACQRCIDAVCGYPFYSHTETDYYTATSGTATTVTVAGAGWAVDQWRGACIRIESGTGSGTSQHVITSNTATVLTVASWAVATPDATSVFSISLASSTPRWARAAIDYGNGFFHMTKPTRRLNVIGLQEYGQGVDHTNIRVDGGATSLTADSGTTTTITKTGAGWTVNQWRDHMACIISGTNAALFQRIVSNTTDTLTLVGAYPSAIDATSVFRILPECIADFDGWFQGEISRMTMTSAGVGTNVAFYYRRDPERSARGSSTCRIDSIWINGPTFYSAWQFGGIGYPDPYQEDNPTCINIRADGAWTHGAVGLGNYYQNGFVFGTGSASNNLNHVVIGLHVQNYESLIRNRQTNVSIVGMSSGPARYGIAVELAPSTGMTIQGLWRAESLSEIVHFHSNSNGLQGGVTIEDLWIPDWAPYYDASIGYAPVVYWNSFGQLKIDRCHVDSASVHNIPPQAQTTNSGTTTTLTQTSAGWGVNDYTGYTWIATGGTGRGQKRQVASNTADTLTFATALITAPDATTVWDLYFIPTFYCVGSGLVRASEVHLAGGDLTRSFASLGSGSRIRVEAFNPLHYRLGGLRGTTTAGPWWVCGQTGAYQQSGTMWGDATGKADVFMDRVAPGRLGISALEVPYLTVPAIGASPVSGFTEKVGAHAGGATTRTYKWVAKIPGTVVRKALPSATMTLTNTLATLTDTDYVRFYPPGTGPAFSPMWRYDVLKETSSGSGTWEVFDDGADLTLEELYFFKDVGQPSTSYTLPTTDETGRLEVQGAMVEAVETLAYSTTIATDMNLGNTFLVGVTDGVAFTLSNPINGTVGQRLTYSIKNTSGGAMGAITWGSEFKMAGVFTNPANNTWRTITFERETSSAWVERGRAMADIA